MGRTASVFREVTNSERGGAAFVWRGDVYAGSLQQARFTVGFIESSELDGFGRRTAWTWEPDNYAVFADPSFCPDFYLKIDGVRDVMGRLRSVQSHYGYIRFSLPDFGVLPDEHEYSWRGYTYNARGHLTREWEYDDLDEPDLSALVAHRSVDGDVNTAGTTNAAEPWNRERELAVGGLQAITLDDSNPEVDRWRTTPRLPGHRLDEVTVDSTTYGIEHDDSGRLTTGLDFDYHYDPRGRLYAALGADESEYYLYDGDGQLVHVERRDRNDVVLERECFAYDQDQIIAAYDGTGQPLWEAVWGAGQDHLVEWHDMVSDTWFHVVRDHRNSVVATFDMWRSPVTGLSYMRNRWYSPRLAQFTSHDPLGFLGSFNAFAFSKFDPINMWDPLGLAADRYWQPCGANDGCFEVPAGAGTAARGVSDWVEEVADDYAEHDKARREENRERQRELEESDSKLGRAAGKALGTLNDLDDRLLGVESRDEVMLGATLTVSGGLLGRLFRKQPKFRPRVCSFTAGTPVLMCDGSLKPIEEVEEGDLVVARDDETGVVECREVVDPYENPDRSIIIVELAAPDGVERIETTDNHPFFVEGRGWTRVDELRIGDYIGSSTPGPLEVVGVLWTDRIEDVYNFGVQDYETYFVGRFAAWVHNCQRVINSALRKKGNRQQSEAVRKLQRRQGDPLSEGAFDNIPLKEDAAERTLRDIFDNETIRIQGEFKIAPHRGNQGVVVFDDQGRGVVFTADGEFVSFAEQSRGLSGFFR